MVLKDRLKPKKSKPQTEEPSRDNYLTLDEFQSAEFKIPIKQLTKKILSVKDNAALGSVVKEMAKFLDSLSDTDASLVFKGNFDIGKKALISCLLSNIADAPQELKGEEEEKPAESPALIRKRRNLRDKLKKAKLED